MAPGRRIAPPAATDLVPFTRKHFFALSEECRAYATALARRDPHHVELAECRRMNTWLRALMRYESLGPRIAFLKPARPVARWQVATLTFTIWLILYVYASTRGHATLATLVLNSSLLLILTFFMLPERVFGTTIEGLEGKLLSVVEALEEMLAAVDMGFSQAAYFQVRDNLAAARAELRQQIDLAHRD